jgi:hypothetical protein
MRPTRTTIAVPLAVVLAAATLAAPATARPIDAPAPPARPQATYELPRDFLPADVRDAAARRGTSNAPEVTVIKVPQPAPAPDQGVDWAYAAIGAGGATGLLAITLAAAMGLRRRHAAARFPVAAG